jgi:hypothetical protein
VPAHGCKIGGLEESLPGILFVQERDVGPVAKALAALHRNREHPFEGRQLAVDGRRLGARVDSLIGVRSHLVSVDTQGPATSEIRAEAPHVPLGLLQGPVAIDLVVAEKAAASSSKVTRSARGSKSASESRAFPDTLMAPFGGAPTRGFDTSSRVAMAVPARLTKR